MNIFALGQTQNRASDDLFLGMRSWACVLSGALLLLALAPCAHAAAATCCMVSTVDSRVPNAHWCFPLVSEYSEDQLSSSATIVFANWNQIVFLSALHQHLSTDLLAFSFP